MTYHKWFHFWWWKNRIQYYFWVSLTIPARLYCFLKGFDYKEWIWRKIENEENSNQV